MDDVEAAFAGYKTTALEKGLERMLEQLRMTDPALGELLDFFMQHFGSLKLAFKQLDINANGALSMQEFADGLRMLRSRRGAGPIEAHVVTLFNRLDYESRGSIALEDIVYELENNLDPCLIRLREFCDEVGKKAGTMNSTSNQDENVKMRHYAGIFRVGHRDSQMSKEHFCAALTHMRYPQWHAEELFHRLDKDDSGHLSLSEFTAFMSPDPPARRRERKGPLVPIGSDTRKKQAFTTFSRSQSPASSKPYQGDCGSGQNQRPDWLALVEHGLSKDGRRNRKHTELSRNGMHVMRGDRECLRDLAPIGCAIVDFNENRERCRISAF
jgi:Ca2+-binding EF-hand superfamily protein